MNDPDQRSAKLIAEMALDHVVKISNAEWLRQVHDIAKTQAVQFIGVSAHQDRLDPEFRSSFSDGTAEPVRQPHVSNRQMM
jgi:hypothetical protein